jgi:outer membrane protein assembly factor BamB
MKKRLPIEAGVMIGLLLAGCAAPVKKPLVDPVKLAFPLKEAGAIEVDGTVVGQPRARDGIVYFADGKGFLTAAVAAASGVLWRFRADRPLARGPELGDNRVIVLDIANTVYVLDTRGSLVFKKSLGETVTTAVRELGAKIFLGTESGRIRALDAEKEGAELWEFQAGSRVTAGPVAAGELVVLGTESGRLVALDGEGRLRWEFLAKGALAADPAADRGRLFFGTNNRFFYGLNAATGRRAWSRRLQGMALHPARFSKGRLAFVASNSALYFLSFAGGSILSWEAVPSRIMYEPEAAGLVLLVSSAAPSLMAFDLGTGRLIGQHQASGPLAAGALWSSPFAVLFEEAPEPGRTRVAFLRSK